MPGPPVLLSSYAARVISCGAGVLSSLSPFRVCVSGSSELGWGSVELLPTSAVRVSFLNAHFVLASALTRRFGYSMLCFFSGSLSRSEGGLSFAFVMGFVTKSQAPPLLLGLWASLYRPNQRETIAMGDCYILCGRSGVPGPLGQRIGNDASRSCCRTL